MNRIGINLWNWITGLQELDLPLIEQAARLGFSAVELPMTVPVVENLLSLGKKIEAEDLEVDLCACLTAGRDISNWDAEIRKNTQAYLLACLETGEKLGAKILAGPLYAGGGKRHFLADAEKEREWDYAVKGLREIAAAAGDRGMSLAIEPVNRYRTSVVNTAEQALKLVQDIGADNVGILFDTYQANIEEGDICGALEGVLQKGRLRHFHACGNNRGAPGKGHLPWERISGLLKKYNYSGHITMETFCPGSLDPCFYPLAENQDALAKEGLEYLKKTFASEELSEAAV